MSPSVLIKIYLTGADPELLLGGAPAPRERLPNILIKNSENPMKLKKFWFVGAPS